MLHSCWCILLFECGLNSNSNLNSNLFGLEIEKKEKIEIEKEPNPRASPNPKQPSPWENPTQPLLPCGPILFFSPAQTRSPDSVGPALLCAWPSSTARSSRAAKQPQLALARPKRAACLPPRTQRQRLTRPTCQRARAAPASPARASRPATDRPDPHVRVISFPGPSSPVLRLPRFLAARGPAPPCARPRPTGRPSRPLLLLEAPP